MFFSACSVDGVCPIKPSKSKSDGLARVDKTTNKTVSNYPFCATSGYSNYSLELWSKNTAGAELLL